MIFYLPSFRNSSSFPKKGIEDAPDDDDIPDEFKLAAAPKLSKGKGAIELPDIKDSVTRKKTKVQSGSGKAEEEEEETVKEKIKRSDIKKFTKVCAENL